MVDEKGGFTHFKSHANLQNGNFTNIDNFSLEEIREQLKGHVCQRKTLRGKSFTSHFISTTDSFERVLNIAEHHFTKGEASDIAIYVIDTHSLQRPALTFLMAHAIKAWCVEDVLPRWVASMLRLGLMTEWIFWDEIVASKVERIAYSTFSRPRRTSALTLNPHLIDLIPLVMEAGRHQIDTARRMPRSTLQARLYTSPAQHMERQKHDVGAWATRAGPSQPVPKSVLSDKRARIDNKSLEDVWNFVCTLQNRNLIFVWMLTLMTQRYYAESIVEKVVERHPSVIEESLEHIVDEDAISGMHKSFLVYNSPGPGCLNRKDIDEYQRMMLACIMQWCRQVQKDPTHRYNGIEVFVMIGKARPLRNLSRAYEHGLSGKCRAESILQDRQASPKQLAFDQVIKHGRRVVSCETDEECSLRLAREYNNMVFTRRVRNDMSHRSRRVKRVRVTPPLVRTTPFPLPKKICFAGNIFQ